MHRKVLVTGSSGLIGGVLVPYLENLGIEVDPYDRAVNSLDDCGDFGRMIDRMKGCDAVVHMAAISWPDPKQRRGHFLVENVVNAAKAVEAADSAGVPKFIFTSSTTVYGYEQGLASERRKDVEVIDRTYLDWMANDDIGNLLVEPPDTRHKLAYITAKIAAEALISQYGLAQDMRVIIMRLAPVRSVSTPFLGLAVDGHTLSNLIGRVILELSNRPGLQIMDAVEPELLDVIVTSATEEETFQWYLDGEA